MSLHVALSQWALSWLGLHSSSGSPQVVFALSCTPTSLCANLQTHKQTPRLRSEGGLFHHFLSFVVFVLDVYCNTVTAANTFAHWGISNVVEPQNPSACNRCDICTLTCLVFYPTLICVMCHVNVRVRLVSSGPLWLCELLWSVWQCASLSGWLFNVPCAVGLNSCRCFSSRCLLVEHNNRCNIKMTSLHTLLSINFLRDIVQLHFIT